MNSEVKQVQDARREAVQRFLDENAELFATTEAEKAAHAERCDDPADCCICTGAVMFRDGWMLLLRDVPMDSSGAETFCKTVSQGLTWSRQLGFIEYVRDALGMA